MTNEDQCFNVCSFANQRLIQEGNLQGMRTGSFLAASSFLFAGFVILSTNGAARPLSIFVCLVGIFLAFLQNRNTQATRRGRRIWEDIFHNALEAMNGKGSELLLEVEKKYATPGWGLFAPTWVQLYWLPVAVTLLWIFSLVTVFTL